jgi:hypothetical protein
MSGGRWNYQDMFDIHGVQIEMIPKIFDSVEECLHVTDLALCGDITKEDAQKKLFVLMSKLGDELFGS